MYFQLYESNDEWRWRLRAANHETIATSGEGYKREADCRAAIDLVKKSAEAPVKEV